MTCFSSLTSEMVDEATTLGILIPGFTLLSCTLCMIVSVHNNSSVGGQGAWEKIFAFLLAAFISIGVIGLGIAALVLGKADKESALFIGGIILVIAPFCMYIMLFCNNLHHEIRDSTPWESNYSADREQEEQELDKKREEAFEAAKRSAAKREALEAERDAEESRRANTTRMTSMQSDAFGGTSSA